MSVPLLTLYTQVLGTRRVLYSRGGVNPVHPLAYGSINPGTSPGEYGWTLEVRNTEDGTGAILVYMEFMDPAGTVTTETASPVGGDHTSEDYEWVVSSGKFDTPGQWRVRVKFNLPTSPVASLLVTRWIPFTVGGGF